MEIGKYRGGWDGVFQTKMAGRRIRTILLTCFDVSEEQEGFNR